MTKVSKHMAIRVFGAGVCICVMAAPGATQNTESPIDADGFRQLRIAPGLSRGASVLEVVAPLIENFPADEEGRPKMTLTMERIGEHVRFDLIETGFADDSVAGEHHRGVIVRSGTGWEMIELGVRPICARGSLSAEGRCP